MDRYKAPLRDIGFVVHALLRATDQYRKIPAFAELDSQLLDRVLEEIGRFAEQIIAPLNSVGDQEGCRLEQGQVRTPRGFGEAYRQYVDAGWPSLGCKVEHGGQGFPALVHAAVNELLCGANQGWTMYPILAHGAYKIVSLHASPSLQAAWLPDIVSGRCTTTMCLTEPQSGSDLGLLRSHAVPDAEGSLPDAPAYRLFGSKIFISGGDQGWTDNLVHLVLARLPDAPPGVKGISLFLVPKRLKDPEGHDGEQNRVSVTAVEHKMGLRGSATCALALEGPRGWLVGKPHQGLAAMFILMNETRLNVGVQAFAVAQGAYDASLAYARERLQMRSSSGPRRADLPADPIIHHPDVRRMLLTQKAHIEGGRMLAYWMALCSDIEAEHPDPAQRQDAADLLTLLTPVAKAFLSDNAFEDANMALQILGGHGYLRDNGIEQRVRDIRITQIYEGTNGIQARDLLSRKILGDGGMRFSKLIHRIRSLVSDHSGPETALLSTAVGRLCNEVESVVQTIGRAHLADREVVDSAAYDVLQAMGHLTFGYVFVQAAAIVAPLTGDADPFYESKMETARFYIAQLMPRAYSHLAAASSAVLHPTLLAEGRLFP